jgi:hypothetical protein
MTNTAARTCFTVAEANRALPLIRSIAVDVVTEFARMREASRERRALEVEASVESPAGSASSAGATASTSSHISSPSARARLDELKAEVNERSARIDGYIRELEELGVDVKDLESGQVEFPSERHARPIWLCWQVGETAVSQWRGENESFADRRPVPAGELSSGSASGPAAREGSRTEGSSRPEGRSAS